LVAGHKTPQPWGDKSGDRQHGKIRIRRYHQPP